MKFRFKGLAARRIVGSTLAGLLALAVLPQGGCLITSGLFSGGLKEPENYRYIEMPELGASIFFPRDWNLSFEQNRFFQLIASGIGPNSYPTTIEFRSLPNTIRDRASRAVYAGGWFSAQSQNLRDWNFELRREIGGDREGAYEYEATFRRAEAENNTVFRRLGKLRFRGNRVHAVYYTSVDSSASGIRDFFNYIDSLHQYFAPSENL